MASPYTLPPNEDKLTGACAFDDGLCTWSDREAYVWRADPSWVALSSAPKTIDSGFKLQSGVLAGADTHVGFLPSGSTDWAGWVDLNDFTDAHPMYGDLLLCTDASTDIYTLFSVSSSGLKPISTFEAEELADPVAGWSAPANPERLLLLGDGGLWALSAPYTSSNLQHLVSFDDVELPASEDFPGFFQPGVATVVIPRRTRTALRLDLSDGTGHATGLAHLPGTAALWTAYLQEDRAMASRLLSTLATLPSSSHSEPIQLYDILVDDQSIQALATSAGLVVPEDGTNDQTDFRSGASPDLVETPLNGSSLVTWGLWLDWDGALESACRRLCNDRESNYVLVESLQVFEGTEAVHALFDLLRSDDPPTGPTEEYAFPVDALRALVTPFGDDVAALVSSALSAPSIPARVAACAAAGATRADLDINSADTAAGSTPVLWTDDHPLPEEALLANATHDHPTVRAVARDTCARLAIEEASSPQASS